MGILETQLQGVLVCEVHVSLVQNHYPFHGAAKHL
jgi:hypothetical protein